MMKERIAIINGIRSPQAKAGTDLKDISAVDLGARVVREVIEQSPVSEDQIGEIIMGNVAQPSKAANIGRVVALRAGFPQSTSAISVQRNRASGMESITTAAAKLLAGDFEAAIAGGTESMSNIPFLFHPRTKAWFETFFSAKSLGDKLKILTSFRPKFIKPVIGVLDGLTDPISGLIMGMTAENLAREFHIGREEQDRFALSSHQKATAAIEKGRFKDEIVPLPLPPNFQNIQENDSGPRAEQSMQALAKLNPYFDRKNGTVTVGNACPITDGSAAVVLSTESWAKANGIKPLGYLKAYAYAGLEPERMGLGPVYATSKLLDKTGLDMKDFDLIELNEAFAAQVLACEQAFGSKSFATTYLNKSDAIGELDMSKVNVNGGAIALGHPVGTTGTRIALTLLKELHLQNKQLGLATLCVGGGQGAALALEKE